ncbi:GlxA family transcriptional regulator [Cyclobacterium jeungdonense]|uniref:Helix-turn-helix domain-containing protein n=1 Tax=Cyclobacterium jeungdonense TaxID=708087 RepID=A0ABT8C7K7_9BACT|nr:helix-turn-helix domain-containing protein [Cyclobacterium jeungdonense]MDN3687661.1 helix-turn-helix domain-containing protein [Cyclobacterium jeungdonense]
MKVVSILVPEMAVPAAIVDPQYMFTAINGFLQASGQPAYFKVHLVGANQEIRLSNGLLVIRPDRLLEVEEKTDLIIIPAISGDISQAIQKNSSMIDWILLQYQKGAEVASLCIGAFILAATGLLKGKTCSTHWMHAQIFRTMFPDVNLVDDRVISEQNGLYSSGGANAYWSLLLYLVEKYTSREMAVLASKYFLLDMEKNSQLPFSIFKGQKAHEDTVILAAQEYLEKHYDQKITVETLAERFGVGRRTLERRFKQSTTNTIVEYMQRVKVEAAKKQLETSRKTVSEIMYDVGYNDPKAFREVFKKYTDMSPLDYKMKFASI